MHQHFLVRIAFILGTTCALFAQSDNGTVVGFVKDPSGAFVPGRGHANQGGKWH